MKLGYIYKITNDINGKIYVGKTELENPYDRWKEHLHDYKKLKSEKRPLYAAIKKYGEEHFCFEVIEKTNNTEERERYWIDKLRTYVGFKDCNGYNATIGGDGKCYLNLNEDEIIKYHIEIANYIVGRTANYFGVNLKTIINILKKNDIVWLNIRDVKCLKTYEEYGSVFQLDINLKFIINIFENVQQTSLYLNKKKKSTNINNACNGLNNGSHYAYGYMWYYDKDLYLIQDQIIDCTWF